MQHSSNTLFSRKIIYKEQDINILCEDLLNTNLLSFDLETTSLDSYSLDIKIVGAGFSYKTDKLYSRYIAFNHPDSLEAEYILELLSPILNNDSIGKIGQNIKYDARVCDRFGATISPIVFDTSIANYCTFGGRFSHNLDDISLHLLNLVKIRTKSLLESGTMWDAPVEDTGHYCMEDTEAVFLLREMYIALWKQEEYAHARKIFYEIDMPLSQCLFKTESNGVSIDLKYLDKIRKNYLNRIEKYRSLLYKIAKREVILTNENDIARLLYEELQIQDSIEEDIEPLKSGKMPTNAATLSKLKSFTAVKCIQRIKEYNKLLNTYIVPFPSLISKYTGYIHCSFNQIVAETGRLSCSNPNLQNIPSRTRPGRAIRSCFISRWKNLGGKILAADFSQAEPRILAHISQDPTLVQAYEADEDVYIKMSERFSGIKLPVAITRDIAKIITLASLYGLGPKKLGESLGIETKEAASILEAYFESMPGFKKFKEETEDFLLDNGYTETIYGRRRYISDIYSPEVKRVMAAKRQGVNHVIQGTCADIVKIAMLSVHNKLQEMNLKSLLIMQIHDEIVTDVHPEELTILPKLVKDCMLNAVNLSVPMKVTVLLKDNWEEAH